MRRNTQESIESQTQRSGECLLWTGFCEKTGYGRVWYQNKAHWVHRLVYEWHHGPIPAGETVDHLCNTRNCIEPSHLDVCSRGENSIRAGQRRDVCRNGHPTSEYRRRAPNGDTYCLMCHRIAQRKQNAKRKN